MTWEGADPKTVESFVAKFETYVAQLPPGSRPSEERVLTMFQRVWLEWKDEYLTSYQDKSRKREARSPMETQ